MSRAGKIALWTLITAIIVSTLVGMGWIAKMAIEDGNRTASNSATVLHFNRCEYDYVFTADGKTVEGSARYLKSAGKTRACTSNAREELASLKTITIHYDPTNVSNNGPEKTSVWLYLMVEFLFLMVLVITALMAYFIREDY